MLRIRVVKAALRVTAAAAISLLVVFSASAQTVRYVHTDGLGSVVLVTDKDRNIIERSEYEPYGSLLNRPLTDGPGYTGHVMDATTGLTYMQQRYYDQSIGRFLSSDPISAISADASFNRYRYANNNPYKFTDPDGRNAVVLEAVIPLAIFATVYYVGTTPEQREQVAAKLDRVTKEVVKEIFHKSESVADNGGNSGNAPSPDLPTGLVGESPRATGKNGGEAVGTSLPGEKFAGVVEELTGGTLGAPNDKGRSTAPNGVAVRTGGKSGPRIDIPANGTKPPEIIHFPENTPVPDNLKPKP
ncbi:RHS repeat-associated core domain-containing protein [Xanthomonas hyacinthi]|uniref:Teneurin-like YD-shell domain-containing protein n=1 Tax=Xanthomonas hyacinthi TaxID=56455 RepID=A0A2S7ENH1_9XANT|nr:RHS repeat-associated core domain-containing protein [Xanthomonas hyacinthi]PPU93046.1 hypothetical protein XhyaCFBP1156_20890 [Xanthomonas hyacinthi]QGY77039.1 RHS repeat-associated core domain-containing protein [Xanthomonas hyacinthi]